MNQILEIQKAILRGDKEYKGIKLPSPQGAGTYTQKSTYAYLKAQEIIKENQ